MIKSFPRVPLLSKRESLNKCEIGPNNQIEFCDAINSQD